MAWAITMGGSSSAPHARRSSSWSSTARTGSSSSSNRVTNSTTAASSPPGSTMAAARRVRSASVIRLRSVGMGLVIPAMLVALALPGVAEAKGKLDKIRHVVVIYEENHSFDNLYGGWPRVDGVKQAPVSHTRQVDQAGAPYACLQQKDVNLATRPCSAFPNRPFTIDRFIPATAKTCPRKGQSAPDGVLDPTGLPGGCTRDLVHRYYQEQYQLNDGRQNRYVTGSDALGLTMGVYRTKNLPIYEYLHQPGHPRYAIADNFFQAAFGGSFLNHQWLVAAATPTWPGALDDGSANDLHSEVDANGMPINYPLYKSPAGDKVHDRPLTASCTPAAGRLPTPAGVTC